MARDGIHHLFIKTVRIVALVAVMGIFFTFLQSVVRIILRKLSRDSCSDVIMIEI